MSILENYLKSIKVQKVLNTKPWEEGFSLVELVVVIAVLAILSAVAIPAFVGVAANARASAVKNGLVNGVKECVVRNADNLSTKFGDVQSFSGKYSKFKIESLDPNSCFKAKAVPTNNKLTWFEIDLNMETGGYSNTCGDSSKPGCKEGNTW